MQIPPRCIVVSIVTMMFYTMGCSRSGPTISTVSGKVTLDGRPVTGAVINFASEEGFGIQAKLKEDGTYALHSQYGKGIPLGSYKVSILPPDPFSSADPSTLLAGAAKSGVSRIPKIYRNFDTSGFAAEVKEGGNIFNFEMKTLKR